MAGDALINLFSANFAVLLELTLLADQTLLSLDAVVRTLTRLTIIRRRLLEWTTAAQAAYVRPTARTVAGQLTSSRDSCSAKDSIIPMRASTLATRPLTKPNTSDSANANTANPILNINPTRPMGMRVVMNVGKT